MTGGISGERLRSFIARIENLKEEEANLKAAIKEVESEAKAAGYDVPTLKRIIKERAMDETERVNQNEIYQVYAKSIGMTPMETYIAERKAAAE